MRDIRASAGVRALTGAGKLRELHGNSIVRYGCWHCGRTGRTTKPASVIVLGYQGFRSIQLAHAGCADPHFIEASAARISAAAGELVRRNPPSQPGEQAGSAAAARHPARGCLA